MANRFFQNDALLAFSAAIAEDAESLAILHDRELCPNVISALQLTGFPNCLGILPQTEGAQSAWRALSEAVDSLSADTNTIENLAVDFASLYLSGGLSTSPNESVWTNRDQLTCQEAMFALRNCYAEAGFRVENWRQRSEDHLVVQLSYLAKSSACAAGKADWQKIGDMLDRHLLIWLPHWASRVALRAESAFYIALGVLTVEWLMQVRSHIVAITGIARPVPVDLEAMHADVPEEGCTSAISFAPGLAPSW